MTLSVSHPADRDLYSESELESRAAARAYARETLDPLRERIDAGQDSGDGLCREMLRELGRAGLMGTTIPERYGGQGLGSVHNALISAELTQASPSVAAMRAVSAVFAAIPLLHYGSEEQRRRWLPGIADGSTACSLAITEPGAGSDAAAMSVTARAVGDGYVIDGVKHYISGSAENDAVLLYAVTTPQAPTRQRFGAFLVPLHAPGITVTPVATTGLRGFSHARVELSGVTVGADARIGEAGQGFEVMMFGLQPERVDIASRALGCAERALEEAVGYASERVQFGKPIRVHQAVSHAIAEMRATVEAIRLLVHRAARLVDAGTPADQHTAIAKLMACERGFAVCDRAMQILGARGYTAGSPVDVMFRDVRALRYGGGTDEIMRHVIQREEFRAHDAA